MIAFTGYVTTTHPDLQNQDNKKGTEIFPHAPVFIIGVPTGSRTPVTGVKGPCPRPLDDGDTCKSKTSSQQGRCGLYRFSREDALISFFSGICQAANDRSGS